MCGLERSLLHRSLITQQLHQSSQDETTTNTCPRYLNIPLGGLSISFQLIVECHLRIIRLFLQQHGINYFLCCFTSCKIKHVYIIFFLSLVFCTKSGALHGSG